MKKTALLLCAMMGASILLGSCANRETTTTSTSTSRQGLVGPGSVAPVSGGPARQPRQKFQP